MDTTIFDTLTRSVSTSPTRRSALRGLVAGAATLMAGGVLLQGEDASAGRRKRRKGKGKGKGKGLQPGDRCQNDNQCPSSYICEVAVNAGNSDRTCCGAQGAGCGAKNEDGDDTAPFCCVGHQCVLSNNNGSSTWTCQAVPDEI